MATKKKVDIQKLFLDVGLWETVGKRGVLFYTRLWGLAEDWGGIELSPERIAAQMGMLKCSVSETKRFLNKLAAINYLIPYECNNKKYGWLRNVHGFQSVSKPTVPKIPLPPWVKCEIKKSNSGRRRVVYTILEDKIPRISSNGIFSEKTQNKPLKHEED